MAGWALSGVLRVLLLVLFLCEVKADVNPGFRVRITKAGLEYARKEVVDLLLEGLSKRRIPVIHKTMRRFQVTLSGLKIISFPRPFSAVTVLPGIGLRGEAFNLRPIVYGHYAASMKVWIFKLHGKGYIAAMGSNLAVTMDFHIGRDISGRPTLSVLNCRATQGNIYIKFRGKWDFALNLAAALLRKKVYKILTREICELATKQIEKYGRQKIEKMTMSHDVGGGYVLDYSLVKSPSFSTYGYADLAYSGLIYMKNHMTVPPLLPPVIQEFPSLRQKMVYVFVTSYMANSALFSTFSAGKFRTNLGDWLPVKNRGVLNTTCSTYICAGSFFPQLSTKYPNAQVTADAFARKSPLVEIRGDTLLFTAVIETRAYVDHKDKKRKFILSFQTAGMWKEILMETVEAAVRLRLISNTLKFNVTSFRQKSEVANSTIGDIGKSWGFKIMTQWGARKFVKPRIVEFVRKRIAIAKVKYISLRNVELIKTPPNTPVLILGMDVRYSNPPA